ncbi:MAG: hypothetical protein Q8N63_07520 [Nanoarchaeota archaeon]|nr:hypothetical protein [Nanoarchaeota archaeon]
MANLIKVNICAEDGREFAKLEGRIKLFNEHYSIEGVGTATAACHIIANATLITPDRPSKIERISIRAREVGSDKLMPMAGMFEATNDFMRIYLGRNEYIIRYNPE